MPAAKTIPKGDNSQEKGSGALRTPRGGPCLVEGCLNTTEHGGRGLCRAHYRRLQNHGSATALPSRVYNWEGVVCGFDGCTKAVHAIGLCKKHAQQEWAFRRRTKPKSKTYEAQKKRNLAGKQRFRERQELEMGRPRPLICENCGEPGYNKGRSPFIVFDHCHDSGVPRGWLCDRCNKVLGLVHDKAPLLRDLALYLENKGPPVLKQQDGLLSTVFM